MIEACFTSQSGGAKLVERIEELLQEAAVIGDRNSITIRIFAFSFTLESLGDQLIELARTRSNTTILIIADWGQGADSSGRQLRRLANAGIDNLQIRYKKDQPYEWDQKKSKLRWSYNTSRGLLHHKMLSIAVNEQPRNLACGSFNWTERAASSYENLVIFTDECAANAALMRRFNTEFDAMWGNPSLTLHPEVAQQHYLSIIAEFENCPTKTASSIIGIPAPDLACSVDDPLRTTTNSSEQLSYKPNDDGVIVQVAFSSRGPDDQESDFGYAEINRTQRHDLTKPSGKVKSVPLTLSTIMLDPIFRAQSGDILKIAMYSLSTRVPEYGALLEAAMKGVSLYLILDREVGRNIVGQLRAVAACHDLPIQVRAGSRKMHQKYLIHPQSRTVVFGTANMTTDSTNRHSENRILVRGDDLLLENFVADFDTIWNRLTP